ncbi:YdcF family protein [Bacillus gobiensis]|uniref:YdcF family protein n=1 Tax=Bacillus gobiensis TaxID=1441095 RepID=UPI003D232B5B
MVYIIKFIYGFLLPPGLFVTLLIALGIWAYRRNKAIARMTLVLAFLWYLLTIPFTGVLLTQSLENWYEPPAEASGDVIVMLGSGATSDTPDIDGEGQLSGGAANRLLTTYSLYQQTELPIILSGGQVFPDSGVEAAIAKRQLIRLGVPEDKIIEENRSVNTKQNAEFTKEILQKNGYTKPVLVASALQMERAVRNFDRIDIAVQPFPTDYTVNERLVIYANQFTPTGIDLTFAAIKEYVGILSLYF